MLKVILTTILGLIISVNAFAVTKGGAIEASSLQSGCQDRIDAKDGYCTMYLEGYIDGLFAGDALNIPSDFIISVNTLRHLFLAHMTSNPEDAKAAAWVILSKTLIENNMASYNKK